MRHEPIRAVASLAAQYDGLSAEAMLEAALKRDLRGRVALVSSFGAESVVLLHLVARVDRRTPVIFADTLRLFPETLDYQRRVAKRLALTDIRLARPDPAALAAADPDRSLAGRDPDACCAIRKVAPLEAALASFDGWISGRKRAQSAARAALAPVEADAAGRVKLNPLFDWSAEAVRAYMRRFGLPPHPLVAQGFPSIGCVPCTTPAAPGEPTRAGRWRGRKKDECGIHIINSRVTRMPGDAAAMDKF